MTSELETNIVSVERTQEYSNIPTEARRKKTLSYTTTYAYSGGRLMVVGCIVGWRVTFCCS